VGEKPKKLLSGKDRKTNLRAADRICFERRPEKPFVKRNTKTGGAILVVGLATGEEVPRGTGKKKKEKVFLPRTGDYRGEEDQKKKTKEGYKKEVDSKRNDEPNHPLWTPP